MAPKFDELDTYDSKLAAALVAYALSSAETAALQALVILVHQKHSEKWSYFV